jgi:hypothetical protein
MKEKEIDPVKLLPVNGRGSGHLQHAVECDRRMIGSRLLTNKSWPHGVVQFHV